VPQVGQLTANDNLIRASFFILHPSCVPVQGTLPKFLVRWLDSALSCSQRKKIAFRMNGLPVFIGSRVFEFNGPFTVWAYRKLWIWIIGHHVLRTKKVIIYSHGPLFAFEREGYTTTVIWLSVDH
jgi:hypothetical protein